MRGGREGVCVWGWGGGRRACACVCVVVVVGGGGGVCGGVCVCVVVVVVGRGGGGVGVGGAFPTLSHYRASAQVYIGDARAIHRLRPCCQLRIYSLRVCDTSGERLGVS